MATLLTDRQLGTRVARGKMPEFRMDPKLLLRWALGKDPRNQREQIWQYFWGLKRGNQQARGSLLGG